MLFSARKAAFFMTASPIFTTKKIFFVTSTSNKEATFIASREELIYINALDARKRPPCGGLFLLRGDSERNLLLVLLGLGSRLCAGLFIGLRQRSGVGAGTCLPGVAHGHGPIGLFDLVDHAVG